MLNEVERDEQKRLAEWLLGAVLSDPNYQTFVKNLKEVLELRKSEIIADHVGGESNAWLRGYAKALEDYINYPQDLTRTGQETPEP